MHVIVEHFI